MRRFDKLINTIFPGRKRGGLPLFTGSACTCDALLRPSLRQQA